MGCLKCVPLGALLSPGLWLSYTWAKYFPFTNPARTLMWKGDLDDTWVFSFILVSCAGYFANFFILLTRCHVWCFGLFLIRWLMLLVSVWWLIIILPVQTIVTSPQLCLVAHFSCFDYCHCIPLPLHDLIVLCPFKLDLLWQLVNKYAVK